MISSKRIYFDNIEMIYINKKMKIPCIIYGSCIGIHISVCKCINIHVFVCYIFTIVLVSIAK